MATEADDAFNQQAVDSLLNFETVLYFNAQEHISEQYDTSLKAVAAANIDSQLSLSLLNILQNAVISVGVALAMGIAGHEVKKGKMTVGDFVLVQVFVRALRHVLSVSPLLAPSHALPIWLPADFAALRTAWLPGHVLAHDQGGAGGCGGDV
jgi:hypothetical protein